MAITDITRDAVEEKEEESSSKTENNKGHNTTIVLPNASDEMTKALQQQDDFGFPKQGDLIQGTVVDISKNGIVVDVKGKLTGLVRGKELDDESGEYSKLSLKEEVEATVLDLENEQGMLELSFRQAGHRKAWDSLQKLLESGDVVDAKVTDANKGGLMVKVGNVEGFLPVSQLTIEHYPRVEGGDKNRILDRLKAYANDIFKVKIITVKEKEEKLIVSEKSAKEKEQNQLLSQYEVGDEVKGRVTGIVDFGVFVEFGDGLEGLVHISELAWQRIDNPSSIVKVNDKIKAKIISIENGRISLSVKKLVDDPWKKASEKYKIGQIVKGKVLKINPYGAFVELDEDIHGLAHISELGEGKDKTMADIMKPGETREFAILSIEPTAHRLGLGLVGKDKEKASSEEVKTTKDKVQNEEGEEKEEKVEEKEEKEDKKKEKKEKESEKSEDKKEKEEDK
jgi:small subunit ribosomal protein S1